MKEMCEEKYCNEVGKENFLWIGYMTIFNISCFLFGVAT